MDPIKADEWPERITLRDTTVQADEGQRILTTATGYGYAKRQYVRADLAPDPELTKIITLKMKDMPDFPEAMSLASFDVLAERRRQIHAEGFKATYDDGHADGEMILAASSYAMAARKGSGKLPIWWPWEMKWWKPTEPRRMLVKAAALIIAEIERLDRKEQADGHQ